MKRGMNLTPAFPWAAAAPKHHPTHGRTRPTWSLAFACLPRAAQTISDEALMTRIVNYDRSAMHMLYARHHVRVYRFALRVLRDRALSEDVVSDVFLEVWRSADQFEGRSAISTAPGDRPFEGLLGAQARPGRGVGRARCEYHRGSGGRSCPLLRAQGDGSVLRECLSGLPQNIARSSISSIFMKSRLQRSRRSSVSRATPSRLACSARASGWQ